ncbi:hypothetical protein [Haloflavibacter putidus]|uniref:Uncharacterized protein n=1 Tax=Haloflavibacter putidus TaxID=2576776 RepID=A0A507ZAE1_9FLAO|nr:hypothetical protein [Haloflavibacter putidus]TQD34029.1 hypothetical protein FKR84_12475 [Haloflavibacter putidus]
MKKETLENLKNDLSNIKVKTFEKKRAKRKKDRESIESDIQYLTEQIIEKYELLQYDLGIKMESHKTDFFIFDVENIIRRQEEKEAE